MREGVCALLDQHQGFHVIAQAASIAEAGTLDVRPDVVITDLVLPDARGTEVVIRSARITSPTRRSSCSIDSTRDVRLDEIASTASGATGIVVEDGDGRRVPDRSAHGRAGRAVRAARAARRVAARRRRGPERAPAVPRGPAVDSLIGQGARSPALPRARPHERRDRVAVRRQSAHRRGPPLACPAQARRPHARRARARRTTPRRHRHSPLIRG